MADAPPEQTAQITAAAEHFVPAGDGAARQAAEEAIVDGFGAISLVTVFIAALATGAAFFIRHGAAAVPLPRPVPHGVGEESPAPAGVEPAVSAARVAGSGSIGGG